MVFSSMNARSTRNKSSNIFQPIGDNKPDVVAITETSLTTKVTKVEVCLDGYKIEDHTPTGCRGGTGYSKYSENFVMKTLPST